jgi:DNA polymerase-3 subunit epsilon
MWCVLFLKQRQRNNLHWKNSTNMYGRALAHFNSKEGKSKKLLNDLMNVDFVTTGSELVALLLEAEEIKKHKPKYNRMRKADTFTHSIDWFTDKDGIVNFKIVEYEESESSLYGSTTYSSAREKLERWIDEYQLCLRYCGLTGEESICFNHQIKKCNGICNGEEEIEIYNKRAKEIIKNVTYSDSNFLILDRGRTNEERSLILIEDSKYKGYGYIDSSHQISTVSDYRDVIKQSNYYPDSDELIKGWIKSSKHFKTLILRQAQDDNRDL